MAENHVTVRLNQQQWELVDKTIERGEGATREELGRPCPSIWSTRRYLPICAPM